MFATNQADIKLVLIRSADVPTYVQYGAADLGIAGKDVLAEHGGEGLYERVDLKIAPCTMMTAGFAERPLPRTRSRSPPSIRKSRAGFFWSRGARSN